MTSNNMMNFHSEIAKRSKAYDKWYFYHTFETKIIWIILLMLFFLIFNGGWVVSLILLFYILYGLDKKMQIAQDLEYNESVNAERTKEIKKAKETCKTKKEYDQRVGEIHRLYNSLMKKPY